MYRKITDLKFIENDTVEMGVGEYTALNNPAIILENPDFNFEMTLMIGIFNGPISNVRFKYMLMNNDVPGIIEMGTVNTGPIAAGVPYEFKIPMVHKDLIDKLDVTYYIERNNTKDVMFSSTVVVYEEY